jgi:cellulose biosynthesis protein BcsQ
MYFAKELAETLKEVGDKHSKVLLLEMNYINPKLRHYLQVQEPRCSIEHMTLSLSDAKSGTINIQALDYSSQPVNELDNFYFIDSLYGVQEDQFVEPFHLKYLLDHFKNVFDFIVITGDLNLKDKFTAAAISESSHMFLSLDMNYANLDRLKRLIETNDKILTKTTPIINMYRDTKKLQPLQYADALGFKEYFVLPYEDEIRDLSINLANNSKLAFAKSPEYKSAIVKLVELYVTKPKKEVKKKLFNFSKGEKR